MTLEGGNTPIKTPEQVRESAFEALKARLGSHEGRFRMVPANPSEGQVTQAEYRLCDPDPDPETDMASAAILIATISDGLTKGQLVERMVDDEDEEEGESDEKEVIAAETADRRGRAAKTVDNLLALGLLTERNDAIELNIDLR